MPYKQVEDASRPFRIWDERKKKHVNGRAYASEEHAINGAVVIMYWSRINESVAVWDVTTGRLVKQFTRKVDSVTEYTPKRLRRAA